MVGAGTGFSALKTKKWQRRYFRLAEGMLRWAHSPETIDDESPAQVSLGGARIVHVGESLEFKLIPSRDVERASAKVRAEYELRATNAYAASRWSNLIDRSIQQLQWRADIESSGVFSNRNPDAVDMTIGTPVRPFPLDANSSVASLASVASTDDLRTPGSSRPPDSPGSAAASVHARAAVAAAQVHPSSPLPADSEPDGAGLTRRLAAGETEPICAVAGKLQAYENSKYLSAATSFDLLDVERRMLKAADVHERKGYLGRQYFRRLFLFNDSLLVVRPYSDDMYQFQSLFSLEEITLAHTSDEQHLEVGRTAASGEQEQWHLFFESAAAADDWYTTITSVARRRRCSSRMSAPPPTPGSSQELVARTIEFDQDEDETCRVISGNLELLVQGSDQWHKVFAHARNGHLHFYSDSSKCPFPTAAVDAPPASPISAPSQRQSDELTLEERLQQQGLSAAFVAAICGTVTLEDIRIYCEDTEYWEQLRLVDPLSSNLSGMDEEWSAFAASFDAILTAEPAPLEPLASPTHTRQASSHALLKLGATLSSMGLEQQSSAVVECVLRDDPEDPMALQIRDELAARGHPVVLSINLGELIGLEMIEFSLAVAHDQQITIRHEELGVFRLKPTSGSLDQWYIQLQQIWLEFVALLGTPKYEHWVTMSQTTSKLVLAYKESAELVGSCTPGAKHDKQVASERSRCVEEKFQAAFRRVDPRQDATRWRKWIATKPQAAIKQADNLMEDLALGMAQAGRNLEIIEWYATEFYKRFHQMLRAFGMGVGEDRRTRSCESVESEEAGLDCSVASSVALDELQTADAMAIIGWCRRFKQRCVGMRIPDGLFEEDPTDSGLFRGLVNAHMPSYQGFLKKKGGYHSGGAVKSMGLNGWQKRYFCLQNATLRYYKTKQMLGERGSIPAEEITDLTMNDQTIRITESGRVLELYAPSPEEASVWCDRLTKARAAAQAMEELSSASTTCIEVQAFDGQQQVVAHSIARNCQERFDEANEKLQLHLLNHDDTAIVDSSAIQAELFMKAADALLEACSDRLRRVPTDRTDVKTFYALEYHHNICRQMRTIRGLGVWPAVSVCRLMFWAREHDQTIARLIGQVLTAVDKPLARSAEWEEDLKGFSKHPLPRFSGWLTRQRWEDHEWEKNYVVIENMCVTWYEVEGVQNTARDSEPEPEPELERENAAPTLTELMASLKELEDIMMEKDDSDPGMEKLQASANEVSEEISAAEHHLKVQGTLSLSETTRVKSSMIRDSAAPSADVKISSVDASVYLKVPRELMPELMECLNQSCYPSLPGQSRDRALSAGDAANTAGAKIVADYHAKSREELTAEIADQFREAFAAEGEQLTRSATGTVDLDAVLSVFSVMLEQLVEVVDEVLFSGLIEEEIINFNIEKRHEQFVEYFTNLCDPEKELFPGSDLNITVTQTDIVPLLRWAAEYHACVDSIGLQNADVKPLYVCCRPPMADHIASTRKVFETWCSKWLPPMSIQTKVETVRQQRNGQYISSLPTDLFRLICDATRRASDSSCERLLVHTVMGVIEPQVRFWAASFADMLSPEDPHGELKQCFPCQGISYKEYLCACLNNMDICYRNTASWSEDVEERIESKDMMQMVGADDEFGTMNTDRLSDSFQQISNAAVACLCNLIMAEIEPELQSISRADWLTHNKMIPMLDSLASWCTNLEEVLAKRYSKKVISTLMSTMIERYVKQLLQLARTPKEKKRARQGNGLTHKDFSAAMQEDIGKLKKFFGTYLKDTAVRAALLSAEVVAQLHGCELESFVAECTKAAYHPEFSIKEVELVLNAREDVTPHDKKRLIA
eukprot:COSAG02_NODE_3358_length_6873_cov_18.182315_3_plen_1815_part_01